VRAALLVESRARGAPGGAGGKSGRDGGTRRADGAAQRLDPGVSLGADLIWPVSPSWALSASVDGFWLDGSTVITNGGERVATSAGAGILLGLGAGVRF
jgi:hypothetical protein